MLHGELLSLQSQRRLLLGDVYLRQIVIDHRIVHDQQRLVAKVDVRFRVHSELARLHLQHSSLQLRIRQGDLRGLQLQHTLGGSEVRSLLQADVWYVYKHPRCCQVTFIVFSDAVGPQGRQPACLQTRGSHL